MHLWKVPCQDCPKRSEDAIYGERPAIEHKPMYMNDYVEQLDSILSSGNRKLLKNSGSISHSQAVEKAKTLHFQ